jgi:hypothetical protein
LSRYTHIERGRRREVPKAAISSSDHVFVVPVFGDSPFLADCLASLRAQWLQSRIVITTSTPSDFIAAVAREAGVDVVVNIDRRGIAADWNFAMSIAGQRYATLAHQDDTYAPDFLTQTLSAFAADGTGVLCFTGYQEIDDLGAAKSSKVSRVKHLIELVTLGRARAVSGGRLRAFLSFGNPLACSSVTFDTKKLRGFRFSSDYDSNLDWDAWWRLMEDGARFLRVPDRLVGRRHNALTATARLKHNGVRAAEDLTMFRRAWPRPFADVIAAIYRWAA